MLALAIEVSSAKKIKAPRTSVSGKGVATGWKGSEDDCLREMKAMQHRIEQLNTENAKLHTELTEFKLKSNHFKDTKTRFLRVTRTYFEEFKLTEASNMPFNNNMPLGLDEPVGGDGA